MAKTRDTRTFAEHRRLLEQAARDLPQLVVLDGEEPFFHHGARETLLKALRERHPGIGFTVFSGGDGGKFDFSAVIEALEGDSLFATEKAVVLRDAQKELFPQKMATGGKSNPWQALADRLLSLRPGVYCLVETEKLNTQRAIGKALLKGTVVPCPLLGGAGDIHAWLQAQAKTLGKTLERGAAELLQTTHGGNLGALAGDLEKLSIFLGSGAAITAETVRRFMPDNEEFNSFELVNALERRDRRRALHFARLITAQGSRDQGGRLLTGEASSNIAVSVCSGRFEQLLRARLALDTGESSAAVAERLKVAPWQAQKIMEAARNFSLSELARILEVFARELHAAHSTGSDIALALERMVLAVCGDA